MKNQYDVNATKTNFNEGDNVWLYYPQRKKGLSPKLQKQLRGPYTVVKRINDLVYKIQAGPCCKANIVHRNRLRRYAGSQPQTWFKDVESSQEQLPRDKPKTTGSRGKYLEREQDDSGNTNESMPQRSQRLRCPPKRLEF